MITHGNIEGLYNGSENINLMRKRIDRIVTMILGLLKEDILLHKVGTIAARGDTRCEWVLNRIDSKAIIELHCLVGERPVCSGPFQSQDIDLELVETVYHNLHIYAQMMEIAFPRLKKLLQPFWNASLCNL